MKKFLVFLIILVMALIVLFAGTFYWLNTRFAPIVQTPQAQLLSFSVVRPNLLVTGQNLARVQIWALPENETDSRENYLNFGTSILSSTVNEIQSWLLTIPADPAMATKIFAIAYDNQGLELPKLSLPENNFTDIYNALWGKENISQLELNANDNGKAFSYALTARFTVILDSSAYPPEQLKSRPIGIIGVVTDVPPVEPSLFAATFGGVATGSCELTDKNFDLHLKIYADAATQETYQDKTFNFIIDYPTEDFLNLYQKYEYLTNNTLVRVDLPANYYRETNLGEAALLVGASSDKTIVGQCLTVSPNIENEQPIAETKMINGQTYNVFTSLGVGAGNYYDVTSYRAVKDNTCYEVVLLMHSSQILNYPPDTVRIFDYDGILAKLEQILNTFTIE